MANTLFGLSHVLVKILYNHNAYISGSEIIYWKSLFMIVYNFFYIKSFGLAVIDVPLKFRKLMILRTLVGFWVW